jgi:hypothetical protein
MFFMITSKFFLSSQDFQHFIRIAKITILWKALFASMQTYRWCSYVFLVFVNISGQTKVSYFRDIRLTNQNISCCQISMNHLKDYMECMTLMKNTHVFHIGTITCDSHMIHMWTTCELKHMWITCESYVNHMWLFQFHMWTTCVSHVGFYMCIFRKGNIKYKVKVKCGREN